MTLRWTEDDGRLVAADDGLEIARHDDGSWLRTELSPRPFLHPVHSIAGVLLTEIEPADHPHHLGVSMAIADVDGVTYWGGPSFVRGQGYTMLENHGRQTIVGQELHGGRVEQELHWTSPAGTLQLSESRAIIVETAVPAAAARDAGSGEVLRVSISSVLRAASGVVAIGSPATNGRDEIGYGGLFWRLPHGAVETVLTPAGVGERLANGSFGAWVAFVLTGERGTASLLFRRSAAVPDDADRPWFVRADDYPGIGLAVAASVVTPVDPEHPLVTSLEAVVVDGRLDASSAATLHRALTVSEGPAA